MFTSMLNGREYHLVCFGRERMKIASQEEAQRNLTKEKSMYCHRCSGKLLVETPTEMLDGKEYHKACAEKEKIRPLFSGVAKPAPMVEVRMPSGYNRPY